MKIHPLAVLALAAAPAFAADFARPTIPVLDVAGVKQHCEEGLANVRKVLAEAEARPGGQGFFDDWNRLQIALQDAASPVSFLNNVHPDKAVRDAAEPCVRRFSGLGTEILQSEKLYARVRDAKPVGRRQEKLRRNLLEGFEDSGVALPGEKRARARAILDRLTELSQSFSRNVRDDPTRVTFTAAEMEGMPASFVAAQKRDADGHYVLGLENPAYIPFMSNATSEAARRRYYVARFNKGGEENLRILEEMYRLRKELAGLYGLPTFAHYGLRRKMVGTPETVDRFLRDVKAAVQDLEKREIEDLRADKAKMLGRPLEAVKLERWDVSFHQERVRRERFAVDQEKLRRYFPTPRAVDFALRISQALYGVRFEEAKVPVWHPDVRYYDVFDAKTGDFLSGFYLDLYPREGKFAHAAAFGVRSVSTAAKRTPVSALVTNFSREGLTQSEFRTLMHEFGHVLHGVLSRAEYVSQGGTSVKRDFVEAPSQMFEEWSRREQPLKVFREVCPECPQLTSAEIGRLDEARRFGAGLHYSRQWSLAAFDLELSKDPRPPLEVWKAIEAAEPFGYTEGTRFPAAFEHLAGGYAAGYYGYMWSEVIALDMLGRFNGDLLDAEVGRLYRDTILSQGGQDEEMNLVKRFLGRAPSSDAFFREIRGQRQGR